MRFLCDEGVEAAIVERLRSDGHEIEYVAEEEPGLTDEDVLEDHHARIPHGLD